MANQTTNKTQDQRVEFLPTLKGLDATVREHREDAKREEAFLNTKIDVLTSRLVKMAKLAAEENEKIRADLVELKKRVDQNTVTTGVIRGEVLDHDDRLDELEEEVRAS